MLLRFPPFFKINQLGVLVHPKRINNIMIKQPKNPIYNTILTGSLSELDEEEDENGIDSRNNDLDLPLKTHLINHDSNFPDLLIDTNGQAINIENDQNPNTPNDNDTIIANSINNDKRVRFETTDNEGNEPTNKLGIEDLLQNASEVNDFLGANIEKLNTFNTDSNQSRSLYKILSDVGTTRTESLSNFDLSENELDTVNSHSFDNIEANIDSILNNENLLNSQENFYNSNESTGDLNHSDYSDVNLDDMDQTGNKLSSMSLFDFSEPNCIEAIRNYLTEKEQQQQQQENTDSSEFPIHLLYDPKDINLHNVEISVEQAMDNFEETINLIINLSHREDMLNEIMSNPNKFHTFSMKNVPSLSYQDLLQRIQTKCMFGSIIYQTATYLFQILLLKRSNHDDHRLKCTHTLHHEEIHRLIIATIRIGAKLTEDFVHSHQYFCKVCGISKKLLSKLEASLLIALKQNRLMINCERLAASVQILEELRSYT